MVSFCVSLIHKGPGGFINISSYKNHWCSVIPVWAVYPTSLRWSHILSNACLLCALAALKSSYLWHYLYYNRPNCSAIFTVVLASDKTVLKYMQIWFSVSLETKNSLQSTDNCCYCMWYHTDVQNTSTLVFRILVKAEYLSFTHITWNVSHAAVFSFNYPQPPAHISMHVTQTDEKICCSSHSIITWRIG